MKIDTKHLIEIIGISGLIASLLFVGYELRLSRSIAQNEGFAVISELSTAIMSLQAEYADIWQRGCLDEELTTEERVIFARIFQATTFRGFTLWARANIGLMGAPPEQFARIIALDRHRFEGYNKMWNENRTTRRPDLSSTITDNSWGAAVESIYDDLKRNDEVKSIDVAWCGVHI